MSIQLTFLGGVYKSNLTAIVLVNNTQKVTDIVVPKGKRWLILDGIIPNPDNVNRGVAVIGISATKTIFILFDETINSGNQAFFPNVDQTGGQEKGPSAYPVMLFSEDIIRVTHAAGGASAGGTSNMLLRVLEMGSD